MSKMHVMLPERIGEKLRRLKQDTGADTLTDAAAEAISLASELLALVKGGGSALWLVSRDGTSQEVRLASMARNAVMLLPAQGAASPSEPVASRLFATDASPISSGNRLSAARAVLERAEGATGRKPMLLQPAPGRSFPDGTMGPPAPGMLTLEQAAERMGLPPKRLLAALREGSFEGAVKDENDDWWVPASEARPQLA